MNIVQALAWLIWQPRLGEQMYHKYQFFLRQTTSLISVSSLQHGKIQRLVSIYINLKTFFCQVSSLS